MSDLKEQSKGLDTSIFDDGAEGVEVGEPILSPDDEDLQKGDLVKRQIIDRSNFELGIYPPKSHFLDHLRANWNHAERIYRDNLRVNGDVRGDTFERYLKDTAVTLDENGQVVRNEDGTIKGYFQSSALKAANLTPRHLFFKLSAGLLPEKTRGKHFDLGEAMHACLMEPTRFSRYVVEPTDSKQGHEGCDVHIEFWNNQLYRVLVENKNLPKMDDAAVKFGFVIDGIIDALGLQKTSDVESFFESVYLMIVKEKEKINLEYNPDLEVLKAKIERLYLETFNKEISFGKNISDDPYRSIIKELGLKKNLTLGDPTKTKPFDPEPKTNLLSGLAHMVKEFLQVDRSKTPIFFRTLEEKKQYIDAVSTASDLESVDQNQYLIIKCLEMNARTYGNGIIYKLARHAHRECSLYLDDYNGTGLPMKIRPDMLQFKENIGVDAIISVKSTSSPNIEKFFYDTAKYQYELSEGMYTEVASAVTGREFRSVITIMYQTVEPWGVAVFFWKPEDIELGRHKFIQATQTLKETVEKGLWPGYDVYAEEGDFGVIDMALPWWAYKGLEERNQEGLNAVHPTGDIE